MFDGSVGRTLRAFQGIRRSCFRWWWDPTRRLPTWTVVVVVVIRAEQ